MATAALILPFYHGNAAAAEPWSLVIQSNLLHNGEVAAPDDNLAAAAYN